MGGGDRMVGGDPLGRGILFGGCVAQTGESQVRMWVGWVVARLGLRRSRDVLPDRKVVKKCGLDAGTSARKGKLQK